MNKNVQTLLEAKKRGVLPQDKEYLLEEAKKRGLIPEENLDEINPVPSARQERPRSRTAGEVLSEAKDNLGPSAAQFAQDTVYPVTNTVDWAKNVSNLGGGVISKVVENFVTQDPEARAKNEAGLDAMVDYFKNRYNGSENIKETIATDPVGFASDVATVLTLGGGGVSKLGKLGKMVPRGGPMLNSLNRTGELLQRTGDAVSSAGNYIDPTNYVTKPIAEVAKKSFEMGGNVYDHYYRPSEFASLSKDARERLAHLYEASNATPDELRDKLTELGPRAFFADLNPTFTDAAEGINQQIGKARNKISANYKERSKFAPQAIKDSLDANMGRPVNVPETVEALKTKYDAEAAPYYKKLHPMVVPETQKISELIQNIQEFDPSVFAEAKKLARAEGIPEQYISRLVPDEMSPMTGGTKAQKTKQWTGAELDFIRRGLSRKALENKPTIVNPDGTWYGIYSEKAAALNKAIDEALSPRNPSQSIYAKARNTAGQGIGYKQQARKGQMAFNNKTSADELAFEMDGLSKLEREAFQTGAREALRKTMNTSATSFKPNGDVNVRKIMNAPENQAKLQTILEDPQAVDFIMGTINSENQFADNFNQVMGNSATARRKNIEPIIPSQLPEIEQSKLISKTTFGALNKGLARIENIMIRKKNVANQRTALDMAKALVNDGISPNDVINGLEKIAKREDLTKSQVGYINNTIDKFRNLTKATNYQTGRGARVLSEFAKTVPMVEDDNQKQDLASR